MLYLRILVKNGIISIHPLNPDEMYYKCEVCVNKNAEYDVIAKEIDTLREKKAAVVTKDVRGFPSGHRHIVHGIRSLGC